MSTQQSQIHTATVEENAEVLWKTATSLGISRADFVKACKYVTAETKVNSSSPKSEPDVLAEEGSAKGPHSTLTPGR